MKQNSMLASDLINQIQNLINQHGDLEIFKTVNGDAKKIWGVDYSRLENHFELI
jgi:hypothetical protein